MMELMQMEMFVAVVEEGGVRAAAERVFRTEPAVSMAIRKLEEEIGAPLFDRSKRYAYRLTEAGEAFFKYAKQMLGLRKEAVSVLSDLCNARTGLLRIGANESLSLHLFPEIAQVFLKQHAGIQIELRCGRSESLLAELRDRRLDLALVSFKPQDRGFEAKFITRDELVLITSVLHPFARKPFVHIEDLAKESILVMDISRPSPWHSKITDAFERSNAPLNLTLENAPIETIKKMVAIGIGIGFVPRISVREEIAHGELCIVPVEGFHQERSVWLVRRKTVHSLAAKAFAQMAVVYGERLEFDSRSGTNSAQDVSRLANASVTVLRKRSSADGPLFRKDSALLKKR
jgi:DNA-binding transcriptional LysR family regulator